MRKFIFIFLLSSHAFAIEKQQVNNVYELEVAEQCIIQCDPVDEYNLGIKYREEGDFKNAFYWLSKAAEKGLAEAKFNLAWFYEVGVVVNQNQKVAFEYIKELANQDYLPAINHLGLYYQKGIGVEKNLKQATLLYQEAIDKGLPSIPYINLSYAYFHGLGVKKNHAKAIDLIEPLATSGDELAMANLGAFYKELNDFEKSLFWTEKAAKKGNALAQANLGFFYAKGLGVAINKNKAIYWLDNAMKKNNHQAFFIMGTLYSEGGAVVEKDEKMAFALYLKSAKLGNGYAQNNLGNWLFNGRYVPKNEKEGFKWYLKAAEENNIAASMYALYQIYSQGTKEIPQDLEKAKYWLEKAKENGFSPK